MLRPLVHFPLVAVVGERRPHSKAYAGEIASDELQFVEIEHIGF